MTITSHDHTCTYNAQRQQHEGDARSALETGEFCMVRVESSWEEDWGWMLPWCLVKIGDVSGVDTTDPKALVSVEWYKNGKTQIQKRSYGGQWSPWPDVQEADSKVEAGTIEMSGLGLTRSGKLNKASMDRIKESPQ